MIASYLRKKFLYDYRQVERLEGPHAGFEEVSLTTIARLRRYKMKNGFHIKLIFGIIPSRLRLS
jgi:hypothetical protein